jgi:hypothetical protein
MTMIRRLSLAFAACCLIAFATPGVSDAASSEFFLEVDLTVTFIDLSPAHGATADNPAEPGGDASAELLRNTLKRLEVRRNMMTVHQVLAWTSLSTLFAAQTVGMINRVSLQSGTPRRATLEPPLGLHRALAATAMSTYYGAGIMAWLSPGPGGTRKISDKGFSKWKSTRDVHIALSIGHNVAMALTIITGVLQANFASSKDWGGLITAHTLSAFTTVGLMIPAAIVISRL